MQTTVVQAMTCHQRRNPHVNINRTLFFSSLAATCNLLTLDESTGGKNRSFVERKTINSANFYHQCEEEMNGEQMEMDV